MARREVIWTKTADLLLLGTLEYWVNRNKSTTYSKKLLKMVLQKTQQIAKTPEMFQYADFPETRMAILENFKILFKTKENSIIITAFWDTRQDPKKLLEILQSLDKNKN